MNRYPTDGTRHPKQQNLTVYVNQYFTERNGSIGSICHLFRFLIRRRDDIAFAYRLDGLAAILDHYRLFGGQPVRTQ